MRGLFGGHGMDDPVDAPMRDGGAEQLAEILSVPEQLQGGPMTVPDRGDREAENRSRVQTGPLYAVFEPVQEREYLVTDRIG